MAQHAFDPLDVRLFLECYMSCIGYRCGKFQERRALNGALSVNSTVVVDVTVEKSRVCGTLHGFVKELAVQGHFTITRTRAKKRGKNADDVREAAIVVTLTKHGRPLFADASAPLLPNTVEVTTQQLDCVYVNGTLHSGRSVQIGSYATGDAFCEWVLSQGGVWENTRRAQHVANAVSDDVAPVLGHFVDSPKAQGDGRPGGACLTDNVPLVVQ